MVPGLPSGQQAYMSNVRLQKSPSNGNERGKKPTVRCWWHGHIQPCHPSPLPAPLREPASP